MFGHRCGGCLAIDHFWKSELVVHGFNAFFHSIDFHFAVVIAIQNHLKTIMDFAAAQFDLSEMSTFVLD